MNTLHSALAIKVFISLLAVWMFSCLRVRNSV